MEKNVENVKAAQEKFGELIQSEFERIERMKADNEVTDFDKLEKIVSEHDYEHAELVVLTDILGGSVNNEFMGLLDKYNFHLITGINLALLFEVVTCPAEDLTANLPSIVEQAREHIVLCNELVEAKAAAAADDQLAELNEF